MLTRFRNRSLLLLFITLGLIASGGLLHADDHDQHDHNQDDNDHATSAPAVSMHEEMEAMGRDYRSIRSQVADPAKIDLTLASVIDLEQHTMLAKSALPRSATTMPTTRENADKTQDYHALMINLLRKELDLEEQLRAGDTTKAAATVAALHDLENSGHQEFRGRHGRH